MPYFVVCPGLLPVSWIYGAVPGCCLYLPLLPKFCIFACVLNLWHCAKLLPLSCALTNAVYFCMFPELMALCQVVASILRCYQCCVFLRVSWIYGTVPGCCLYPSLLPMLCIFCPCPLILPVSWVVSPMLPLSWVVKRVLSPTALYKPGVKLNMEEGARIVHPLQTLRCSVPFTRRRHFCLTRVLTNNHTCNFHVSKNRSTSLTRISRFLCVY